MNGENKTPNYERYDICQFQIMSGGITPKVQPIDMVLENIFKGYYLENYDIYILNLTKN